MHKLLFLALIVVICIFQIQLHYGRGGHTSLALIKAQIAVQIELNTKLMNRNDMMKMKIAGLKGSTASLEARARNELNLIKPNEILILLPRYEIATKDKRKH